MLRERSDELRYTLTVLDLFLSGLAFVVAYLLRFSVFSPGERTVANLDLSSYIFFGVLLAISQAVVFSLLGLYRNHKFLSFINEIGLLFAGAIVNIAFSFAILYYLRIYEVSRLLPVFYGASLILLVTLGHMAFRSAIYRISSTKDRKPVVIVGTGVTARRATEAFERNPLYGYEVKGFILEDPQDEVLVASDRVLGTLDGFEGLMEGLVPRHLVFAGDHGTNDRLRRLLEVCDRHGIQFHVVPSLGELVTANGLLETLNGLPLISIRDIPARSGFNRILKRTFDIVFSGLFLLVFSPLYLLIALAVKVTSPGPVFFLQDRVGLDNKVFKILKFRTMRVQTEQASNTKWTTKDDPRITPIGKFLRKSSLDEIPQFINIFLGQMSVVGPRPERPYFVEQFKDQYHYFQRRHAVKAGLTGWAQINGLRGDTSIQDRIDADIYYIENWTFFLDLKIVFLTPFKGMIHQNAY